MSLWNVGRIWVLYDRVLLDSYALCVNWFSYLNHLSNMEPTPHSLYRYLLPSAVATVESTVRKFWLPLKMRARTPFGDDAPCWSNDIFLARWKLNATINNNIHETSTPITHVRWDHCCGTNEGAGESKQATQGWEFRRRWLIYGHPNRWKIDSCK